MYTRSSSSGKLFSKCIKKDSYLRIKQKIRLFDLSSYFSFPTLTVLKNRCPSYIELECESEPPLWNVQEKCFKLVNLDFGTSIMFNWWLYISWLQDCPMIPNIKYVIINCVFPSYLKSLIYISYPVTSYPLRTKTLKYFAKANNHFNLKYRLIHP